MVKLQKSYVFIIFSEIGRRTAFPYVDMDTKKSTFISEVVSWCHVYLLTWLKSQQQKFQDIIYLLKKAIHFKTKRVKCLSKNLSKSKSIMLTRSIPTLPFFLCFIFCRKYKQLKNFSVIFKILLCLNEGKQKIRKIRQVLDSISLKSTKLIWYKCSLFH